VSQKGPFLRHLPFHATMQDQMRVMLSQNLSQNQRFTACHFD
jgi:hypothetical protein